MTMTKNKKPKKSGPIRLSYTIPAVVLLALAVLFNLFFLNTVLKYSLIAAGEMAVGAKVDIASVSFKFKQLSITINQLAITDRDAPMKNLIQAERIQGALKPLPLLSKKIVISELEVSGLQWGTARKTSGALPPGRQKNIAERMVGKDSGTAKLLTGIKEKSADKATSLPAWQDVQNAKDQIANLSLEGVIKPEELESVKQAQAAKQTYQNKSAAYDKHINSLDIQAKLDAVKPALEDLKNIQVNSLQDAAAAKTKIETAQQKIKELNALKDQINDLQKQAKNDFGETKNLQNRINTWQNQDMKSLTTKLKLPSLSFGSLTEALVGPVWLSKIHKFVALSNTARKYMPTRKKNAKKTEQPRMRGVDVYFPHPAEPPAFLIGKIILTGTTGGEGKAGTPINFSGNASNLTSDPRLLGIPAKADLGGSQSGRSYTVTAVLDHTQDIAKDTVRLNASGLSLADMELPKSDYLPRFDQGSMAIESSFMMDGEKLTATLKAVLGNLKAPAKKSGDNDLVADLWQGVDKVNINATVSGIGDNLDIKITSDLDKLLNKRLNDMAGEKLGELRNKLKAEINKYSQDKQKELMDQYGLSKNSTLNNLTGAQNSVQAKIDDFKKQISEKQNAGKQAADQKKKAAEDELKKKANDQLKNLF
ncbi:TIGR03545 family protein [bacterium]|nr:TIGR03545 family protein [bacterium]